MDIDQYNPAMDHGDVILNERTVLDFAVVDARVVNLVYPKWEVVAWRGNHDVMRREGGSIVSMSPRAQKKAIRQARRAAKKMVRWVRSR